MILENKFSLVFTARRYSNMVYMLSSCVCGSVRLSQAGIVEKKRLNIGSPNNAV